MHLRTSGRIVGILTNILKNGTLLSAFYCVVGGALDITRETHGSLTEDSARRSWHPARLRVSRSDATSSESATRRHRARARTSRGCIYWRASARRVDRRDGPLLRLSPDRPVNLTLIWKLP